MQTTSPLTRAFDVNSPAATFAAIVDTTTEPAGVNMGDPASGIFNLCGNKGGVVPDAALVSFFGAGADNATFDARLIGWDRIGSDPMTTLWVWRVLASFTCTLSGAIGVAGAKVINTDRFADTLVVNAIAPQPFIPGVDAAAAPISRGTIRVFSPANDIKAYAIVPLLGCEKLQFDFDSTGATNSNALFRFLNDCD